MCVCVCVCVYVCVTERYILTNIVSITADAYVLMLCVCVLWLSVLCPLSPLLSLSQASELLRDATLGANLRVHLVRMIILTEPEVRVCPTSLR